MTNVPSNTQVDRLGDRLRGGALDEADLTLLDDYRRSFGPAYENVVNLLRDVGVEPTGRPAKSTPSLVAKMNRESIRLSQVQDIAGCRVVVADLEEQERVKAMLVSALGEVTVFDRTVEIQIRTMLQHTWAELSEKLSDLIDPAIKYGGGPAHVKDLLLRSSSALGSFEEGERLLAEASRTMKEEQETDETRQQLAAARGLLPGLREALIASLKATADSWTSDIKKGT